MARPGAVRRGEVVFQGPEPKWIEWPPGSGERALYTPEELDLVQGLVQQVEEGEITLALLQRQLEVIHTLKTELGASFLLERPDEEPSEQLRLG